jgi:hypothetical protein
MADGWDEGRGLSNAGHPLGGQHDSMKCHANSVLGPPSDVTGSAQVIRLDVEIEVIGNPDAGRDLEARAAIG